MSNDAGTGYRSPMWNATLGNNQQRVGGSGSKSSIMETPKGEMGNFTKFGLAAQGTGAILGAANAWQQYRLQKKQFKASLADRNQNNLDQSILVNNDLENQASVASQLSGNRRGSAEYEADMANRPQLTAKAIKY